MPSSVERLSYAPGARVVVRDAEWVVRRVDRTSDDSQQLTCDGISELVRGEVGIFHKQIDRKIQLLDPAATRLIPDTSPQFAKSLLFMESQLRQAVPSDSRVRAGHLAAMDSVPYQLEPARQALRQPRQRILIADSVGLGKTLEAGILVSELIARGRGRRILVLAVSSMLTQFQKEFWNRFTIPLTRLDSSGIQRVRRWIPANHNPFHYYDKAIISIDTLKQVQEYGAYLESAYWDIIVIDEAHNVADRGTGSQRSRLAQRLSSSSDTLIMLSATPHDGKARSFASLMNMLDPTAIADPDDYRREDFSRKGLVIRRFKKDIQGQVTKAFRDRKIHALPFKSSPLEEEAFEALLQVRTVGGRAGSGRRDLFAVGLEKGLFSSPRACLQTVDQRLSAREREGATASEEVRSLKELRSKLECIDWENSSRYQALLTAIRNDPFQWNGRDRDDRLVVFTERIETLKWLCEGLMRDLNLKEAQVGILHGTMSDVDQQEIVDAFGNRERPVRLLICSDVASEGINLHYRCHRLIHFDMPWSLMVFQQRNGRIDRYGQERTPEIVYLASQSENRTIRGDERILEVLQTKDDQAQKNIGDPSAFMKVHEIAAEEAITAEAIAKGEDSKAFDRQLTPEPTEGDDLLALFLGKGGGDGSTSAGAGRSPGTRFESEVPDEPLSLFASDLAYCEAALHTLRGFHRNLDFGVNAEEGTVTLEAPDDLKHRFSYFPREVYPDGGVFALTDNQERMRAAIEESRRSESSWPRMQYLWRLNPVVQWIDDRMMAVFGRDEAPVLAGVPGLEANEVVFVISGLAPNRKSHPLVYRWVAAVFSGKRYQECVPFEQIRERVGLGSRSIANRGLTANQDTLKELQPEAVLYARDWVRKVASEFQAGIFDQLGQELADLDALKKRQLEHVRRSVAGSRQSEAIKLSRVKRKEEEIEELFDQYLEWVEDTMNLEDQPWLKVMCVMTGESV